MKFRSSKKVFIHVDCDSFFAECEILKNPTLKDKYVIVWDEIVLACNYKTKAFWINTWTPIWQVKKILKNMWEYLPSDHEYYSFISSKMMEFLEKNTLSIEPFSIDEAFCEVTWLAEMNKLSLEDYILKLQKDIITYVWVPVSIWVSTTRIKAKIFSKLNKPRWIFIDTWNSLEVYKTLNIAIVPFIGPSMRNKLKYKCSNVYDFLNLWYWYLNKNIWKNACDLWLELSWVNSYTVKKNKISKSISRGRSFNKNITNNKDFIYSQMLINFNYLYEEFTIKKYELKKVTIFFRDKEKITTLFHHNLWYHTYLRSDILKIVQSLFLNNYSSDTLYRSTWVVFSNLKKQDFHQINLFEKRYIKSDRNLDLINTINNINKKFNVHKISFWSDLLEKKFSSKLWIRK